MDSSCRTAIVQNPVVGRRCFSKSGFPSGASRDFVLFVRLCLAFALLPPLLLPPVSSPLLPSRRFPSSFSIKSSNGVFLQTLPAISAITRDLSRIHAQSGLGARLVSLCTAFPALGLDSVRHAHDFRAMRFCLPIRLGMAITFALASHSVRYTQHFRFLRFRPVRLQNGMEIIECLVPCAPLFSARSRARRLRYSDDLSQLYTMILMFPSAAESSKHSRPLLETTILFETSAPFPPNRHS